MVCAVCFLEDLVPTSSRTRAFRGSVRDVIADCVGMRASRHTYPPSSCGLAVGGWVALQAMEAKSPGMSRAGGGECQGRTRRLGNSGCGARSQAVNGGLAECYIEPCHSIVSEIDFVVYFLLVPLFLPLLLPVHCFAVGPRAEDRGRVDQDQGG